MILNNNPWEDIPSGARRRIEFETRHDYFWMVGYDERYVFYMKLDISGEPKIDLKLKGVEIFVNTDTPNKLELYLVLENKDDWEIFYVLCKDLISNIDTYQLDEEKLGSLLDRLLKWKNLLASRRKFSISLNEQMGLFAELECILNVLSKYMGYEKAVHAWVGSDMDKQDFSLERTAIEVKAHKSTKGNIAHISSVEQLYSEKENLYLISYAITKHKDGQSIDDLYNLIAENLEVEMQDVLSAKLFQIGWIPNFPDAEKEHFFVDAMQIYHVNDGFPRIKRETVDSRIDGLKYRINLSMCKEFIVEEKDVFNEE
jgi:hypothetical protein